MTGSDGPVSNLHAALLPCIAWEMSVVQTSKDFSLQLLCVCPADQLSLQRCESVCGNLNSPLGPCTQNVTVRGSCGLSSKPQCLPGAMVLEPAETLMSLGYGRDESRRS